MKILLFIDSLGAGGAQRQLLNLGRYLVSKGYSVNVLVYHDFPFYKSFCAENNIEVITVRSKTLLMRIMRCRRIIRRYSAVISFLEVPNFIASISASKGTKLIVSERNNKTNITSLWKERLLRLPLKRAAKIVTNSKTNKENLVEYFHLLEENIQVIYNSLCPPFDSNWDKPISNSNRFLVVSSFQPHKNQLMVLKALEILRNTDISVDFYGGERESGYLQLCRNYVAKSKIENVRFCGETDMTQAIYANYRGLIHVSAYEGLPNVVIEALSTGISVIYTPVSDLPYILGNTQNVCVPFNDHKHLADSILRHCAKNPPGSKRENQEIAKALFSRTDNFEEFRRLLH